MTLAFCSLTELQNDTKFRLTVCVSGLWFILEKIFDTKLSEAALTALSS